MFTRDVMWLEQCPIISPSAITTQHIGQLNLNLLLLELIKCEILIAHAQ